MLFSFRFLQYDVCIICSSAVQMQHSHHTDDTLIHSGTGTDVIHLFREMMLNLTDNGQSVHFNNQQLGYSKFAASTISRQVNKDNKHTILE